MNFIVLKFYYLLQITTASSDSETKLEFKTLKQCTNLLHRPSCFLLVPKGTFYCLSFIPAPLRSMSPQGLCVCHCPVTPLSVCL